MPFGPLSRKGPVRVQPFFGYRNAQRIALTTRAIRAREPVFKARSFWRDFATMLGQYNSKEVAGLPVTLEFESGDGRTVSQQVVTDADGYARFDLALDPECTPAERTGWEQAIVRWPMPDGSHHSATAHILTPGTHTQVGIISDIDDTILETGVTSFRKIVRNWKRVMATMPSERTLVPDAPDFYAALGGGPTPTDEAIGSLKPEARVRPVFYVSSSPWNLFSYLVTFKRERKLPLGPVMLRDWGWNRETLGKSGHGSHKRRAIETILNTFPKLKFALIGDDTQKDLAAFGSIASDFPGRIAAVFIRSVSGDPLTDEELHAIDIIEKAGVPFWTGNDYREAKGFLRGAGLELKGGVKKLVRAATEGPKVTSQSAGSNPA